MTKTRAVKQVKLLRNLCRDFEEIKTSEIDVQALNVILNYVERKHLRDNEFLRSFIVGSVFWLGFCIIITCL
ncbi:hypothetical protein FDE76_01630 [Clostridium botulinum]|uniref:Uncharacterized protein n=1 Tax=Clostridium botulinum (strain Eklund 17B / Type B) TaxID=935198 RepID=B2TMD8_CLOBB|nr:hypothetical protein [Clostridium sp. M14]ACD24522.1 hypothetical protein CLL_A0925 [Clostridium botulinum B str. Eklund 17B (NRP)]MBY6976793.1 hypothetical protein [Clostridium botulinum]MBY7002286.1 hypothetical protein [Clostridium botulinum]MBZ9690687.1 hypothetical protein [Clostridium sp. M14]MCR1274111.1 hypothetical protein [Clostridium botulinum]